MAFILNPVTDTEVIKTIASFLSLKAVDIRDYSSFSCYSFNK